ncbi:MAG: hypothetical protein ACLRNQ_21700 [Flavonifractor plautii]
MWLFIFLKFAFWKKIFSRFMEPQKDIAPGLLHKIPVNPPLRPFSGSKATKWRKKYIQKVARRFVGFATIRPALFVAQEVQKGRTLLCPLC